MIIFISSYIFKSHLLICEIYGSDILIYVVKRDGLFAFCLKYLTLQIYDMLNYLLRM